VWPCATLNFGRDDRRDAREDYPSVTHDLVLVRLRHDVERCRQDLKAVDAVAILKAADVAESSRRTGVQIGARGNTQAGVIESQDDLRRLEVACSKSGLEDLQLIERPPLLVEGHERRGLFLSVGKCAHDTRQLPNVRAEFRSGHAMLSVDDVELPVCAPGDEQRLA
jgi:hypothetical protein